MLSLILCCCLKVENLPGSLPSGQNASLTCIQIVAIIAARIKNIEKYRIIFVWNFTNKVFK